MTRRPLFGVGSHVRMACGVAALSLNACSPAHGTIGAMLAKAPDGRVYMQDVPDGLAAQKAGLRSGDEVLLVDGVAARDLSPENLHAKLSGEVGDAVKLTVLRGDQVIRVTLLRTPARHFKPGAANVKATDASRP